MIILLFWANFFYFLVYKVVKASYKHELLPLANLFLGKIGSLVKMLEGKAVLRETDMPELTQTHVMELAYQALDLHEVSDCQSIAHYIKQVFFLSL